MLVMFRYDLSQHLSKGISNSAGTSMLSELEDPLNYGQGTHFNERFKPIYHTAYRIQLSSGDRCVG